MNLFPKERRPYYIYTPSYTHISSGVRTLHLLTHALNEAGEKAYLLPDYGANFAANPHLNTPIIWQYPESRNFYANTGVDPTVVYPDIVRGNPVGAKHVVRYLLAPAGAYGGDSTFPETDNIWGVLPSIASKVLTLPVSDPVIFHPNSSHERKGSCFYAHKYNKIHGNPLLSISNNSTPLEGTLGQVADILRRSEVCYMYEVGSILTEAALCGCSVVLVRTDYFNTIDKDCLMGTVSWSDGEIVKVDPDYWLNYQAVIERFPHNLQLFIKDTQEMA